MDSEIISKCGCPACLAANAIPQTESQTGPIAAADYTGTRADALASGYSWANARNGLTLTYKFHPGYQSYWSQDSSSAYNSSGMTVFSASQKQAVQDILGMISSFTRITFSEVGGSTNPQIGFVNAFAASTTLAGSAYYPTGWQGGGDIFINKNFWGAAGSYAQGSQNYFVLMHEIGHALGLRHSFEGLSGEYATEKYSVMAYDMSSWGNVTASSYMLYDIAALQDLYGTNMDYNSGDTTYVLTPGKAMTIWDGGGTDTLDSSSYQGNTTLNLNAGSFSSVGLTENLAIAYGVTIENAATGSGNDIVYGNQGNNRIMLGSGNDTVYFSAGQDIIDGGEGGDILRLGAAFATYSFYAVGPALQIANSAGATLVTAIETFIFSDLTRSWNDLFSSAGVTTPPLSTAHITVAAGRNYNFASAADTDAVMSGRQIRAKNGGGSMLRIERDGDDLSLTSLQPKKLTYVSVSHEGDLNVTASGFSKTVIQVNSTQGAEIHAVRLTTGTLRGGDGDDRIEANLTGFSDKKARSLVIDGKGGDDEIIVTGLHSKIKTTLLGQDGDDHITFTGSGTHSARGGNGNDVVHGRASRAILYGEEGNDRLEGDAGNDILYGGNGDDILNGGRASDYLYGQAGADIFVFDALTALTGRDIIGDFSVSDGDVIDVSALLIGFDPLQDSINDFVSFSSKGRDAIMRIDQDGDGTAHGFREVALVSNQAGLDAQTLLVSGNLLA